MYSLIPKHSSPLKKKPPPIMFSHLNCKYSPASKTDHKGIFKW